MDVRIIEKAKDHLSYSFPSHARFRACLTRIQTGWAEKRGRRISEERIRDVCYEIGTQTSQYQSRRGRLVSCAESARQGCFRSNSFRFPYKKLQHFCISDDACKKEKLHNKYRNRSLLTAQRFIRDMTMNIVCELRRHENGKLHTS
jgi:hypothetical protein